MLVRIEIFIGIAVVAILFVIAGYAITSGIMLAGPSAQVRVCVARGEQLAAQNHKSVSRLSLTETCERVTDGIR